MTTFIAPSRPSSTHEAGEWSSERSTWRRLARVVWLQHRAGLLSFLAVFIAIAIAIFDEMSRASGAYASFVSGGCVAHLPQLSRACNTDALALSGGTELRTIGDVLMVLPLLVAVFLGAPLVARELESGTFRFAWTQGLRRSGLVLSTLVVLALAVVAMGILLGLLYGGWYAHMYEVALAPDYDQWQATLFATTWWMLPMWMLLALSAGGLAGTVIRPTVPAMAATAAVIGASIAGMYLALPHLLGVGASVRRLAAPVGTMAIGTINDQVQPGWRFPAGSWVVRSWLTGPGGHVLGATAVHHVAYELSARTTAGEGRWLAQHHDAFWVSYQPSSHFWAAQGAEGVVVLALAVVCVAVTLRCLRGRVNA